MKWTKENFGIAVRILGRHRQVKDALSELGVSESALFHAFKDAGLKTPAAYLGRALDADPDLDEDPPTIRRVPSTEPAPETLRSQREPTVEDERVRELVRLAKKGPLTLTEACNALEMSPEHCEALVAQARERGYAFDFTGRHLEWRVPAPREDVQDTGIAPVVGPRQRVAVVSDLHFGSKWCGRAQLRDFLEHVREMGIKHVLNPGDDLDGCYKFSRWEQSHHGWDEQADDAYELWRDFPDLTVHRIDGNHDETFSDASGQVSGRAMVDLFRSRGLHNTHYYGGRSALLRIHGAVIHLWHPRGSGSYALSYKLHKKIEAYPPGGKPDILLTGHYHQYCVVESRGVHGFLCPTFQLPGGNFGNSLVGGPSVGGLILGWELTEDRTLRRVHVERVSYYQHEQPRDVA